MSKRGVALVLLGIVCYLGFLLATLPAAQVWSWFGDQAPVRAYGLGGTIWDGRAALVQQEHRRLEDVQWQLSPLTLLIGRARVETQARADDGRLRGTLTLSSSSLLGNDLRMDMPAPALLQWLGVDLPVKVEGHFDAFLQSLALEDGLLTEVDGVLNWNRASVHLGRPLALGDVALRLTPGDKVTLGQLINQNSPLDLNGDLRLEPDGQFTLDLTARLKPEASEEERKTLIMIGIPADGSPMRARLSGALDGSGMSLRPLNG